MSHRLVTSLALEGADGQFTELMVDGRRHVAKLEGLVGLGVRESVRPRPGRHGIVNTTRYRDSLPVVVEGELFGETADDAWAEYNALATVAAAAVATDRQLRWTGGPLDLMEQRVRVSSLSPPIVVAEDVIRYQLILRPEDPRSFAQNETLVGSIETTALSVSGGGKVYPYQYPRGYTPAGAGTADFTVTGTDTTPPVFEVHGFISTPTIELVSTGEQIRLNASVDAGRYLEVDVAAREVRLDDGSVRNNLYDFANSSWFDLPPGPQSVRLSATTFDTDAFLRVRYRNAYA